MDDGTSGADVYVVYQVVVAEGVGVVRSLDGVDDSDADGMTSE